MNRRVAVLIVSLAALLYPREAQARWTRVTTEHFVFVGDASEASIRSIAAGRLRSAPLKRPGLVARYSTTATNVHSAEGMGANRNVARLPVIGSTAVPLPERFC